MAPERALWSVRQLAEQRIQKLRPMSKAEFVIHKRAPGRSLFPFRDLLIMMETDTLAFESFEDVTDVEHSWVFQRGQRSLGLREEPLSKRFVTFKLIAFFPPGSALVSDLSLICPLSTRAHHFDVEPDHFELPPSSRHYGDSPNYGNKLTDNDQLWCFGFSYEDRLIRRIGVQRTKLDPLV